MTKIKICGIKTYENALMVAQAGADMIGLNFYTTSPRYIDPNEAKNLVLTLREVLGENSPLLIGLFVNATYSLISEVIATVGFDYVQLSGDESDSLLKQFNGKAFKAIRPATKTMAIEDVDYFKPTFPTNEKIPSLILDAFNPQLYGGTGETASIDVARSVNEQVPRLMLAGGLNPDNIATRMTAIQPWGVDVASGVEADTPGIKDEAKVKAFVEAVKGVSA